MLCGCMCVAYIKDLCLHQLSIVFRRAPKFIRVCKIGICNNKKAGIARCNLINLTLKDIQQTIIDN